MGKLEPRGPPTEETEASFTFWIQQMHSQTFGVLLLGCQIEILFLFRNISQQARSVIVIIKLVNPKSVSR